MKAAFCCEDAGVKDARGVRRPGKQFVKQGESGLGCSCLGGWCRCKKASCRRGGRDAVNSASFRPSS